MSFISPNFPIFAVAALILYFVAPQRARWCVMLASSYVFYWLLGGFFAIYAISFTIATVYASGLWAGYLRTHKARRSHRRIPLAACLTVNFGLLMFFKYGAPLLPSMGIMLIPGISFYTFQAAGYLVDIYKGKVEPERNPLKTALFLSFFPQLIQGPISRHSQIAGDLFAGHGWDWKRSRNGVQRIIWGYFLKFIVANRALPLVSAVFAGYRQYGGTVIFLSAFVSGVQLYADFSGGIDISLGVAEIFGIRLPENFRQPYFANSLMDFWRRWHMTLNAWLKDYLFYPLALSAPLGRLGRHTRKLLGNRAGKMLPTFLATFCVYFIVGIWHGIGVNLLVFALLNGSIITAALIMEPLLAGLRAKTGIDGSKDGSGRVFAILRTIALITLMRYIAGAESIEATLVMLRRSVLNIRLRELWNGTLLNLGMSFVDYAALVAGMVVLFIRDLAQERGTGYRDAINAARPAVQFVVLLAMLAIVTFFGIYSGSARSADFIYANY